MERVEVVSRLAGPGKHTAAVLEPNVQQGGSSALKRFSSCRNMERMRGGHYEVDTQEFKVPALVKHIDDPRTQAEWTSLVSMDPFGDPRGFSSPLATLLPLAY